MKKCNDCDVNMIEAKLHGEPFDIDLNKEINDFTIRFINGTKEVKGIFGKVKEKQNYCESEVKTRVCPKCGKIELYTDILDQK